MITKVKGEKVDTVFRYFGNNISLFTGPDFESFELSGIKIEKEQIATLEINKKSSSISVLFTENESKVYYTKSNFLITNRKRAIVIVGEYKASIGIYLSYNGDKIWAAGALNTPKDIDNLQTVLTIFLVNFEGEQPELELIIKSADEAMLKLVLKEIKNLLLKRDLTIYLCESENNFNSGITMFYVKNI